jgi:hypothetical protein
LPNQLGYGNYAGDWTAKKSGQGQENFGFCKTRPSIQPTQPAILSVSGFFPES